MSRRKMWGFTIIEVVVVAAIIGVLAAIAYPLFADQARKARRADAMTSLERVALAQEKLRANCTRYATGLAGASSCTARTVASATTSTYGYYTMAIAGATSTAYTITATPKNPGAQAKDVCGTFSFNQDGPDLSGSYANAACWKR